MTKDEARVLYKAKREALNTKAIAKDIVQHLLSWQLYQKAQNVLIYLAFGSEFNLKALQESPKDFYTTRTHFKPVHLTIHSLSYPLEKHRYGYYQPVKEAPVSDPKSIDLVLVPALAFDLKGTRLGYGMGFYDRLLGQLRPDCPRVGICSQAQIAPTLPKEAHDVAMTHLVSELGIVTIHA